MLCTESIPKFTLELDGLMEVVICLQINFLYIFEITGRMLKGRSFSLDSLKILQIRWKFSYSKGFIDKMTIYSGKISEFFFKILMGISVAWIAFREFVFLISLKTSTLTWRKQKLDPRLFFQCQWYLDGFDIS